MNEIDYETEEGQAEQERQANPQAHTGWLSLITCLYLQSVCNSYADVETVECGHVDFDIRSWHVGFGHVDLLCM